MLIALRIELPSPESDFLKTIFDKHGEVEVLDPLDVGSHTKVYDLAVGVGPITSLPLAHKKIQFVLGPSHLHLHLGWDAMVVTSPKTKSFMTGYDAKVYLQPIPLLQMEAGRRRIMKKQQVSLSANSMTSSCDVQMCLWGKFIGGSAFSAMEFNSLCRHGAYGCYMGLEDGYDVQVRRHLALGSPVFCKPDSGVVGELASHCRTSLDDLSPQTVVEDTVSPIEYENEIDNIIRSL